MKEKNIGKIIFVAFLMILAAMSSTQAVVRFKSGPLGAESGDTDFYYNWSDDFDNEQWIDSTLSYDYDVSDSCAKIKDTYTIWTDPSWTKMKPISITNNAGKVLTNFAFRITVNYDSDMQSDYDDIRFKHENFETVWLDYWIEDKDIHSATVWINVPELPIGQSTMFLFYGNPSAAGQSNFYNVFSDWEPQWENDERISTHVYTEGAWDPDVAYGNGRFLIVWEEGQAPYPPYTYFFKQDIRGSIYNTNGEEIKLDFQIRSGQEPQWHHENPSVAYGAGKFFVAWEHYATSTDANTIDIIGRFVSQTGDVSASDINICMEPSMQADPHVTYDNMNNRFMVVWEDERQGSSNSNIYAKLFDVNGNQIGSEKIISSAANNQREPWAAYDPLNQNYVIVWEEKSGSFETDIWMGLFDKNLNCIGPNPGNQPMKITNSDSNTRYLYPCVAFSEDIHQYLITWNEGTTSKPYRGAVWGKLIDESGSPVGPTMFKIKDGSFIRTDIVPYLSTSYLVAYNGGGNIWGKFISSDGEVFDGDIQLSASNSAEADWANMAVNENIIFVVWEDTRVGYIPPFNGVPDIFANIWHLNIENGSEVSISIGNEKQLILEALITSKKITFDNIESWHDFDAQFEGSITFDVLNEEGASVLMSDISPGADLSTLNDEPIRLRARLTRNNPSYSPTLDKWTLRYLGVDDDPPITELDHIDGTKENNDWYTDESVTIWLYAEDYPKDTGSGVDKTYYTLNGGAAQEYDSSSGLHLSTSQASNWMGVWDVVFWSVDKSGNIEDKNKQENRIKIKIDAEQPYVQIIEPADEQQVDVPFWVRVDATDNVEIDRVEFDIEPFGTRENLPFPDYEPPYEWYCEVGKGKSKDSISLTGDANSGSLGVNRMIRATVYDKSGQFWSHEIYVFVSNWNRVSEYENSNCLIIAPGTGTTSRGQNSYNVINQPKCFAFGEINWQFTSGFCFSAGTGGIYNINGAHFGNAQGFIGIAGKSLILGYATYIKVVS
jgi:hypothetical protein